MAGKTSLPTSGWKKSAPNPRKQVIDMASVIKQLRDQAQGSNNGGGNNGGGGGGVAAPTSTLASLPQTPELAALIQSGMIREGMDPTQALGILATSKLSGQVPIDIAALKAMIAGDYASSTQGVTGPATEWMQQLFGANAPDPSDPMYAQYMADPIFSQYAGGLQQMQQTANTNEATDLAWFDKQQQAMTDYYNGLMATIGITAPVGSGGGGGGGGGGYGGGGGGSGGGGDWGNIPNPYEFSDPKTKATEQQRITQTSTSDVDEMAPDYWQNLLTQGAQVAADPALGMSPEDQAIFNEYLNTVSTKYTGNPNDIMSAATTEWEDMIAKDEEQRILGERNAEFDRNAPDMLNAELSNYLMSNNLELGDDPNQPGLQTFRPMLDSEGNPITNPNTDPAMMVANQEAQAPLLEKLNAIFGAAHAPGAGMGFDPSGAVLNKIFTYLNSEAYLDPAAFAARSANYTGPYSTLNTAGKGSPGQVAVSAGGNNGGWGDVPSQNSIPEMIAAQTAQTGGGSNKVTANGPAGAMGGPDAGIGGGGISPSTSAPTGVDPQVIWSGTVPQAAVDPVTGQPPADESAGLVWDGNVLVPADQAQTTTRPDQTWGGKPWDPSQLGGNWRNLPKPKPDLRSIIQTIASQMPPATGPLAGSVPGSPQNPPVDVGGNISNPPTMTPTGIPIGTQSTAPPSLPPTSIYKPQQQGFEEFDGGTQELIDSILHPNQLPPGAITNPPVNGGYGRNGTNPNAPTWGNKRWDPSQMGGWHIPQSVKDSLAQSEVPMEQQMQEGFGNESPYPPGEQWRAQLNQSTPQPNAEANIQALLAPLYNKIRNPTTFSGNAPVGNDPYVAPPQGSIDWGNAVGGTPTTEAPSPSPLGFGGGRIFTDQNYLGVTPDQAQMSTGNKTLPTAPPVPQPDPAVLQQIAQAVLSGAGKVAGNVGAVGSAPITRAPATAQSMLANLNLQGVSFAPAAQELLQSVYGNNSAALDAAYQAWLALPQAQSGQAVGGTRTAGLGTPAVFQDWQTSRFDPKTGMISDQVMDILHGRSYDDYVRSLPAGTDIEMALANNPGKIWQTPETPEQYNARQVQEAANRWLIAPSREASTWWHPAVWKNRDQTQAQEQSTINSSAVSYKPEAALPGLVASIQYPRLMEEPQDTLDVPPEDQIFDDTETIGWRNPASTQLFTKPPTAVMNNINKFVGGLKNTANPQQAIQKAAQNRLQAKQTLGGGKKVTAKLGGKY